jgi:hypothetical protein
MSEVSQQRMRLTIMAVVYIYDFEIPVLKVINSSRLKTGTVFEIKEFCSKLM